VSEVSVPSLLSTPIGRLAALGIRRLLGVSLEALAVRRTRDSRLRGLAVVYRVIRVEGQTAFSPGLRMTLLVVKRLCLVE